MKVLRSPFVLFSLLASAVAAAVLLLAVRAVNAERLAERERSRADAEQRLHAAVLRIRNAWDQRMAAVLQACQLTPQAAFAAIVRDHLADSAVMGDRPGHRGYPALPDSSGLTGEPGEADEKIAALRKALTRKDRDAATALVDGWFLQHPEARTKSGRSAALAAGMLFVSTARKLNWSGSDNVQKRLVSGLNQYPQEVLTSSQRVFLMDELAMVAGVERIPTFPLWEAERMALGFLTGADTKPAVVRMDSGTLLFRPGELPAILHDMAGDAAISIAGPEAGHDGAPAEFVHPGLPGWRAVLTIPQAVSGRLAGLIAAGCTAAAVVALLGFLIWRSIRRRLLRARLQEDLAATVSHELRTPVASMRVLAESLLEEASPDPAKVRDYLKLIAGENVRLSRLIDNFLTLARIERGRSAGESAAVGEIVARTEAAAAHLGARVRRSGDIPDVRVAVACAAAETALVNLLDNACKFSPPDSEVEWSVAAESDGRVTFQVRDEGGGPPESVRARMWEPFERAAGSSQPGCGLGLAIVKRIVQRAGGSVSVETGNGCTFRLSLPVAFGDPA